jgi:cobalt/nickel transport system permease protein
MFGVDGKGNPIYFPFSMQVTIPALVGAHALFFGIAEGIATILVVSFVRKIGLIRNEKQNIQDNLEMAQ